MYSFQANAGRRKDRQHVRLLCIILFILVVALVGITYSYIRVRGVSTSTSEALLARAINEASEAQSAVYRLTQSSGTNTASLLASVRSHIYALQCLNTLTASIYGAGTAIIDGESLSACITTLDQCDVRLQAGSVLTDLYTVLRDQVDEVVALFGDEV